MFRTLRRCLENLRAPPVAASRWFFTLPDFLTSDFQFKGWDELLGPRGVLEATAGRCVAPAAGADGARAWPGVKVSI